MASLVSFSLCRGFEFKMRNRHGSPCVGSKEILLSFHKPIKQWNGMVMPPLIFMLEDIKTTLIFLAVLGENALEAACQGNSIVKECSVLSCRHSSPTLLKQRFIYLLWYSFMPHTKQCQTAGHPEVAILSAVLCFALSLLEMKGNCTCMIKIHYILVRLPERLSLSYVCSFSGTIYLL